MQYFVLYKYSASYENFHRKLRKTIIKAHKSLGNLLVKCVYLIQRNLTCRDIVTRKNLIDYIQCTVSMYEYLYLEYGLHNMFDNL